ncbi:MAG: hypothetical protein AAF624_05840 [Bacteroidota bacterium]
MAFTEPVLAVHCLVDRLRWFGRWEYPALGLPTGPTSCCMSRVLLLLGLLGLSTLSARAQQVRVGVGVSIEPLANFVSSVPDDPSAFSLFAPSLYVPVTVGPFRLEPELSLVRDAASLNDETESSSRLRLGVGLFYYNQHRDMAALYVGARLGLVRTVIDRVFLDETATRLDYVFAPTLGGEHYVGDLSLGVESQLQYSQIGNFFEGGDTSRSQLLVRALLFVRYHF